MNYKKSGHSTVESVEVAEQRILNKGFSVVSDKIFGSSFGEYQLITPEKERRAVVNQLPEGVFIQYYDKVKESDNV